jgi:hypothetical protein
MTDASFQLPLNISASRRLVREWKTMAAMVRCYCHDCHASADGLCPACRGLLDYATRGWIAAGLAPKNRPAPIVRSIVISVTGATR